MFHLIRRREEKQHKIRTEKESKRINALIISFFSNPNANYQKEHQRYSTNIPLPLHFRQSFYLVHLSISVPVRAFLVTNDMHVVRYIRASAGRRGMGSFSKQTTKQAAFSF